MRERLQEITVRFARWDLSALDMIDARTGTVLCVLHPLDRTRNADGLRRVIGPVASTEEAKPKGIAPLLAKLMADYAATGLPPAYLPLDEHPAQLAEDVESP